MARSGVQPSGCVRWQAEACTPERLPDYFVNVQKPALRNADLAVLQINPVTVQAGVQPSGCERWQAEVCAPERLPSYFVNVQ
jgi:hypothetical protein